MASIKERYSLTKGSSSKSTHHIVLDIANSGIEYSVGDVVGIYPQNDASLVAKTLEVMGYTGTEEIQAKGCTERMLLKDYLTSRGSITTASRKFLQEITRKQPHPEKGAFLQSLFENKEQLKQYLEDHEIWKLLSEHPQVTFAPQEFVDLLMPLLPRFYSISSSGKTHPDEIHLTVSYVNYEVGEVQRQGVCSHYICNIVETAAPKVSIYLLANRGFTLPDNHETPIIMIGPGTGVAPFRGFLHERIAMGAKGGNWLFFGERNRETDFFYRDEWERWVVEGKLRLELAFSRDQAQKVYVQHRLHENAKEVYAWLENGAYFYVCGDARRMARDVEATLLQIISKEGNKSEEEAKEYLKSLRKTKRYLRDVY